MLDHKVLQKRLNYYVIDKNVYDYIEKYSESLDDEYMKDYRSATADDDFINNLLS